VEVATEPVAFLAGHCHHAVSFGLQRLGQLQRPDHHGDLRRQGGEQTPVAVAVALTRTARRDLQHPQLPAADAQWKQLGLAACGAGAVGDQQ
jgi:hypothetical protein